MGCQQCGFDGRCHVFEEGIEMPGCSEEGFCVCDSDPDPSYLCDQYQSDWECPTCGFDLNSGEDCGCEDGEPIEGCCPDCDRYYSACICEE